MSIIQEYKNTEIHISVEYFRILAVLICLFVLDTQLLVLMGEMFGALYRSCLTFRLSIPHALCSNCLASYLSIYCLASNAH